MKKQIHKKMSLMWMTAQVRLCFGAIIILFGVALSIINTPNNTKALAVVCNPRATSISNAVCMQDINRSVIDSMREGNEYYLYDSRDDERYLVSKLADGNVWMLDNLRLGHDEEMVLTSADTNIDSSVGGGRFVLPSTDEWEDSYEKPFVSDEYKYYSSVEEGWFVGNYYNFCAASAGTYCREKGEAFGDASYDICPAGWRMPTGSYDGEYETIFKAYDSNSETLASVLHLTLSGRFSSSGLGYFGDDGYFWASTYRSGSKMRYMIYDATTGISPTSGHDRDRGYSMRCVAKGNEVPKPEPEPIVCNKYAKNIDGANCLQDVNPLVKHSMVTEQKYTLVDKRDGEKYVVSKLKDGNVWLLENLRLGKIDPITLTPEDTNISTGTFVLPGAGNWLNTYVEPKLSISNIYELIETRLPAIENEDGKAVGMSVVKGTANLVNPLMIGNYYNYCAASAGTVCEEENTGDAEADICPASWRMPTDDEDGEFMGVFNAYGGSAAAFMDILKLPLGGRYYSGNVGYVDHSGYFWSSTFRSDKKMRMAVVSFDGVEIVSSNNNDRGLTMRCLSKVGDYGSGDYEWVYGDFYNGDDKDRLVLRIDMDIRAFDHLEVNGEVLSRDNYSAREGSTIIHFKNSYLDTLDDDTYALKAVYIENAVIDTTFTVEKAVQVPNTGWIQKDENSSSTHIVAIVLASIAGLAGAGFGVAVLIKRHGNKVSFNKSFDFRFVF